MCQLRSTFSVELAVDKVFTASASYAPPDHSPDGFHPTLARTLSTR
jgi:hypothetical protein